MNQGVREEEERALRQVVSGIIPEWQETSDKGKRETIEIMKVWTGDMMNWARINRCNGWSKRMKIEHMYNVGGTTGGS
eukprot:6212872-Pleurochrysis_carterae.AAC.2